MSTSASTVIVGDLLKSHSRGGARVGCDKLEGTRTKKGGAVRRPTCPDDEGVRGNRETTAPNGTVRIRTLGADHDLWNALIPEDLDESSDT